MRKNYNRKTLVKRGKRRRRLTVRKVITVIGWILTLILLYLLACLFVLCGPAPIR